MKCNTVRARLDNPLNLILGFPLANMSIASPYTNYFFSLTLRIVVRERRLYCDMLHIKQTSFDEYRS